MAGSTALLLVVVCSTIALNLWWTPTAYATWWYVLVGGALCILASLAPNPWVAMLLGWLAVHPLVSLLALRWGWIEAVAPGEVQLRYLLAVVVWGIFYLVAARSMGAASQQWRLAVTLVVLGLCHLVVGILALHGIHPSTWRVVAAQEVQPLMGYTGSGPTMAWLLGVGCLSAAFLAHHGSPVFWGAFAALFVALPRTYSYAALASTVGALMVYALYAFPQGVALAAVPGIGAAWFAVRRGLRTSSWIARREVWTWGWRTVCDTWGIGLGLGTWARFQFRRDQELADKTQYAWLTLHNDFLQALVEVGAVPVLLFVGYGVTHALGVVGQPDRVFPFVLVLWHAVYGLVYSPLHVHPEAIVLAVAMGALDSPG